MSSKENKPSESWKGFHGPNLGVAIELYEEYTKDPDAVDEELRALFDTLGPPPSSNDEERFIAAEVPAVKQTVGTDMMRKIVGAVKLADTIRMKGHLASDIHPIQKEFKNEELLQLSRYDLTEADLRQVPVDMLCPNAPSYVKDGFEAIEHLKKVYTQTVAFEFGHVQDEEERNWLYKMVESDLYLPNLSTQQRINLLKRLTQVEGFEKFIHRTFVGQKRFSIEGLDVLVPMLDEAVRESVHEGTENIMIGMAHRGRLNVLTHTLGKPYHMIFSEFLHAPKEDLSSESATGINGWTGDVKYHLGADRQIKEENTVEATVTLANNPSHLEFVSPIVEGYARAAQEDRSNKGEPVQDTLKAYSILIHGDAAFPGQGIVTETLNLSRLTGYQVGGSLHIIANNNIGFTTETYDSRSTTYSSDPAKGFEIPILHVNADDPEACMAAIHLAFQYRKRFKKDFLIDLVGYRRLGHNETDDPFVTQPETYSRIKKHPTVRAIYADYLTEQKVIEKGYGSDLDKETLEYLRTEYDKVASKKSEHDVKISQPDFIVNGLPKVKTAVDFDTLKQINEDLLKWPNEFKVNDKLGKILKRRLDGFEEGGKIDWAHGEVLAFASIISDGTPVRLSGQDSERGTFVQRHLVLHDKDSNELYTPLKELESAKASFAVYNSPLSEAAVVGFEYGYNVQSPETLVLWEAQFGDFANGAQVMFDQWIAAGRAKWGQKSGLVVLLPHGYEGQGPEHSSGRVERFLVSAAENNWTIANCSSAAQYFHLLRRQAAILKKDSVRPLIIMTPKSLLRNSYASSDAKVFSEGEFLPVLEQPGLGEKADKVERILLCSGKVSIDLAERIDKKSDDENWDWLHIARVEELYPFPKRLIRELFANYKNLKEVIWVQEEPKNMGAWPFMESRIRDITPENVNVSYIGRTFRSSPAEGNPIAHKTEQERIITESLTRKK
ncbi:2-oxoglutarate dehydrogenase E1 [Alkalihalobacillus alcalophilus ATCC 27647 = CGMCC 1.3604]|uniref:2-oxoglutarate dehydrogenase E1 component n=1 Tax=Alkalihalobacillus alcalophilus ATCC 27647 = CGMCC 1.3604 TaxID=1218173 RepID=A0A094WRU9_ALKAL|nr:2-oxoglutarate dehydrogenase E1 component [Alkalihalobacillus alcalophilus]KGA98733.1 2-oxoglutarate dehydrogenase [Alkalihalobacillus alcalophilus ATCC 27647 = CGMCC 1.3604]MED1562346.1 2-oxoglutarate dehydrogenase E1 component [Alkalihalobacillus alcalophilus]THG89428.1 2-oxoglutarate dehydrogenase E1 [Alkalihalobacillus alcalophilus ATCC 27647 = CGMCC 1.3604]